MIICNEKNMNKIGQIYLILAMLLYGFSTKAQNLVVSGAGSPTLNGTYIKSDLTFNGYAYWVRENDFGEFQRWICFQTKSVPSGQWAITQMEDDGDGNFSVYTIYYLTALQGSDAPATG